MKVYFVRHGEGEHNVKKLYSASNFKLTPTGIKQAKALSKRLKGCPIDLIIASPFLRTVQTAEIINKSLGKKIILSDLAVEIKRSKEIAGKILDNPEVLVIKKLIDENFHLPNWHYSDEENFYDLKKRAEKFINFLEKFKQKTLLVVTHSHFLKMVILSMLLKNNLTPEIFLKTPSKMKLETGSLVVCQKDEGGWKLVSWNEYSTAGS